MRWRKRQQGQVARKQYIDLVGAQEQWGEEKLPEHESNKSRLHEPVSIRPSLLRSASYKVSLPEPAKDKPELCEPAECRPAHGSLRWIACGKRLLRIESKEGANDIPVEPEMDAETTMDGVNAAEETTATVNLVERTGDAHMHKRRRTNPTPDHVPSTNVWHHTPTQTEAPKLAPRRPPAKRRTHKRTRKAAKQDGDASQHVNKRPAESETVSSESCKTKQDASVSAKTKGRQQTSSRDIRSFSAFGQSREAHKTTIAGQAETCTSKRHKAQGEPAREMPSLKGLCWNVRGLTTVLHELTHLVGQLAPDFVILTETS